MNLIDVNKTIDLIKLKFYNEYLYAAHLYEEGEAEFHQKLTTRVVAEYVDPIELAKDSLILDLGCGPGYFLDEMKSRGYTNLVGVTLSPEDAKICTDKGHTVKQYDISFIPQKDGYYDESVDFIFLRHALEHSPYPIFSLMEYNRLLKQNSKIYIEVPAPDCERKHEFNLNHYSIFGPVQLAALLQRTGFKVDSFNTLEFELGVGKDDDDKIISAKEKYFCIVATKVRALDVK
jgi:SAM-dependent methyltransferase|tara:strand:- start:231 stop:929 length:699 start_codon:yes stop_codon:yes gene_type:complete